MSNLIEIRSFVPGKFSLHADRHTRELRQLSRLFKLSCEPPPGSVVDRVSARRAGHPGSNPGRVIHKTLKFELLLPCLALSILGTEQRLVAQCQDNVTGWVSGSICGMIRQVN